MRALKIAVFAVLSGGWTIPLFLSVYYLAEWNELVVQAGSVAAAVSQNSFPFVAESKRMAAISCGWAFVAAAGCVGWSLRSRVGTEGRR